MHIYVYIAYLYIYASIYKFISKYMQLCIYNTRIQNRLCTSIKFSCCCHQQSKLL